MLTKTRKVIRKRKSSKFKMYDYTAGLLKEFGRYFLSFLTRKHYIINDVMDYRQEGEIVDRCFELYLKEHSDLSDCRPENFKHCSSQGLWKQDCLVDYDNNIAFGIYRGKLVYATLDEMHQGSFNGSFDSIANPNVLKPIELEDFTDEHYEITNFLLRDANDYEDQSLWSESESMGACKPT